MVHGLIEIFIFKSDGYGCCLCGLDLKASLSSWLATEMGLYIS